MFEWKNIDPRAKIMLVLSVSTGAMVVKNLWFLGGLLLGIVLIMAMGGISLKKQFIQAKGILGMIVFLFLLQTLLGQGIMLAGVLALRLLIVVVSAMIVLTGQSRDYLLAMTQCKIPYEIAYMVMTGLHFFPILREEALDVYYSAQLRGTEIKKASVREKLKLYLKICLPILMGAMERAKDMSIAMEARCFRANPYRSYMRKLVLKGRDKVLIFLFPMLMLGFTVTGCGILNSDPIPAPDQIALSWTADPAVSQTISWRGQREYKAKIRYAEKGSSDYRETDGEMTEVRSDQYYRYKGVIDKLKPDTAYTYSVGDGRTWSKESVFRTAAKKDFSFMYLGDVQYEIRDRDYEKWGKLVTSAYKANAGLKFAILGGDMVNKSPDLKDWGSFFSAGQPVFSKIPMMTVPGNHETSILPYTYLQMTALPQNGPVPGEVYSFDYGDGHFLMVNSCLFMDERKKEMGKEKWSAMMRKVKKWIDEDLAGAKGKWKVAVMHHPPYPVDEDDSIYGQLRESWGTAFQEGGVKLVLCGHQHVYMRTKPQDGVVYMMGNSGQKSSHYYKEGQRIPDYVEKLSRTTGTYQVISVTEEKLACKSYDTKGKVLDSFQIQ